MTEYSPLMEPSLISGAHPFHQRMPHPRMLRMAGPPPPTAAQPVVAGQHAAGLVTNAFLNPLQG